MKGGLSSAAAGELVVALVALLVVAVVGGQHAVSGAVAAEVDDVVEEGLARVGARPVASFTRVKDVHAPIVRGTTDIGWCHAECAGLSSIR